MLLSIVFLLILSNLVVIYIFFITNRDFNKLLKEHMELQDSYDDLLIDYLRERSGQ